MIRRSAVENKTPHNVVIVQTDKKWRFSSELTVLQKTSVLGRYGPSYLFDPNR